MKFSDLDTKMRRGEFFHGLRIPDGVWTVLRLDGRSFSKFTKDRYEKPFDINFHNAMMVTTSLLVKELGGIYGYTESDEISILFPLEWDIFDREVEKVVSISASLASVAFSRWVEAFACFDARIWFDGRPEEVVDYFQWRQADSSRNALNAAAYWSLRKAGASARGATSALDKATVSEKNEILHGFGLNFNDMPTWQRRGSGVRWEFYEKDGYNPKTQETVKAIRRRLVEDRELPMKDAYGYYIREILL